MKFNKTKLALCVIAAAMLPACGGGSGSGNSSSSSTPSSDSGSSSSVNTVTRSIVVQNSDGSYVENATVCIDMNQDFQCGSSQSTNSNSDEDIVATVKTSSKGAVSLTFPENLYDSGKQVIAVKSNQFISSFLLEKSSSSIIRLNSVSNLVSLIQQKDNISSTDAKTKIANAIGLDSSAKLDKELNSNDESMLVFAEALDKLQLNSKSVKSTQSSSQVLTKVNKAYTKIGTALNNDYTKEEIISFVNLNISKDSPFDSIPQEAKSSTNTAPVADFEYTVKSDGVVEFVSTSTDVDNDELTYTWFFGDANGSSTSKVNPKFAYNENGTYKVSLIVSDGKLIAQKDIEVVVDSVVSANTRPTASFSVKVSNGVAKFESKATDADGDALTYLWDFGDGNTSTDENPTHEYAKSGSYRVSLTVNDGKLDSQEAVQLVDVTLEVVDHKPTASFETKSNELEVKFTNKSSNYNASNPESLKYVWEFGDGTKSEEYEPTHKYSAEGTYTVKLTVDNGEETATYETSVKVSKVVVAENHAPKAAFTQSAKYLDVQFSNSSKDEDGDELSYVWDFGDKTENSTEASPKHTYAKAGSYAVKLTVSDGKESASTTSTITVKAYSGQNTPPSVDFHYEIKGLSGTLTAVASDEDGDKLTYLWEADEGITLVSPKVKTTNVTFKQGGKNKVKLTVSDGVASVSKEYTIELPNYQLKSPTKEGIYYKGDKTSIYAWDSASQKKLLGEWPGKTMETASEDSSWKFIDTSSISESTMCVIFNNPGQTADLCGAPSTGCYNESEGKWSSLSSCSLADITAETVEGGADIPEIIPCSGVSCGLIGDIPWNELDYGSYKSTSTDVSYIEAAPFVYTDLAPGSYHENKVVNLYMEDADRQPTSGKIYYTLDNTKPTEESTLYSGPISLDDTSTDGLGTAYRLRTLVVGDNGMKQEQHFFWFVKKNATVEAATDFRDETIYFVVTARYNDGDKTNNYYCRDRYDKDDPSWRGDFKGLIEKLDYIKDMGFTAIWVTPPVENRSGLDYHGYHAYDWFQPDLRLESPGYTYFDFIKAAHKKGIKVIQDVVLNHSSNYGIRGQVYLEKLPTKYYISPKYLKDGINYGPYVKNLGDYESYGRCDNDNPVAPEWHRRLCAGDPDAKATFTVKYYDNSITVDGTTPNGEKDNTSNMYFWNLAQGAYVPEKWYHQGYTMTWEDVEAVQQHAMAGDCIDLKTENENVRNYMNSAIKMYIDMGIDAIRIDTLKHMPREDVMAMTKVWQQYKPGMFIFGEALIKGFGDNTPSELLPWYYTRTSKASETKSGDSGISVLDFSLMSTFRNNVTKGGVNELASVFERFDSDYADATKLVTFFQNHDLTPDNTWSGSGAQHCCTDRANSALAYNVLWTVRGIPTMYAGDETGVRVGLPPDLTNSDDLVKDTGRIYVGDSIDNGDPIIGHITDLNAVRKSSKALQRGTLKVLQGEPFVFDRTYEGETVIVAIPGTGGASVKVTGSSAKDGTYVDVISGKSYTVSGGSVDLGEIPGASMRVLVKGGTKVTGNSEFLK